MSAVAVCQQYWTKMRGNKKAKIECNTTDGGWKALVLYRYISWLLTSIFYLLGTETALVRYKLLAIISLFISSIIIIHLYEHGKETIIDKLTVVIIETLGIALFLIPTGGVESPFMWYALNPIFMAAILLPGFYCWGILLIFLTSASIGSIFLNGLTMVDAWSENHWLMLVFLLLTTVAYLLARLIRQLSQANEELSVLYSASEMLLRDPGHLADLLAAYARKTTNSPATLCYLAQGSMAPQWVLADSEGKLSEFTRERHLNDIWHHINEGKLSKYSLNVKFGGAAYQLICVPLQSVGNLFGFLGYIVSDQTSKQEHQKIIGFLAELGAIALERQKTDELASRLMVSEEQNRIANEIHDGVSQYLFSIVYALHGLAKKQGSLQDEQIQSQLNLISNTASKAAKELRASIYRISPRRRGEQVFIACLASYLEGLARLNNIHVDLQSDGSEEALSPALRKALYRIVREATSNAIRHGKCSTIEVNLQMEPSKVILRVIDNGRGFDVNNSSSRGLGLTNMSSLMASFQGRVKIESNPGLGTNVICTVPD